MVFSQKRWKRVNSIPIVTYIKAKFESRGKTIQIISIIYYELSVLFLWSSVSSLEVFPRQLLLWILDSATCYWPCWEFFALYFSHIHLFLFVHNCISCVCMETAASWIGTVLWILSCLYCRHTVSLVLYVLSLTYVYWENISIVQEIK